MVHVAAQTGIGYHTETFAEAVDGDTVDNLVEEGAEEQKPCLVTGNAALLHVEECFLVELADGGTV